MRSVFGIVLMLAAGLASGAELRDLRLLDGPDGTRVVFDLDRESAPKVFTLGNPDRVVIDFSDARLSEGLAIGTAGKGLVRSVRTGPRDKGLRVVLDVATAVNPKSFGLQPSGSYGYRVIVDLANEGAASSPVAAALPPTAAAPTPAAVSPPSNLTAGAAATPSAEPAAARAVPVPAPAPAPTPAPPAAPAQIVAAAAPVSVPAAASAGGSERVQIAEKPIVVAVDAGHGGEDPGARGRGGLQEKDVTLAIARRLARKIDAQPGMRAVLTRDGDYFVELRERTVRARRAQADLFVSVHANAYKDRDMRGTAVYVLSDRGATSEQARWIASHENAADLVGGVKINNKADDLAAVLIDISQSATMEASFDLGSRLLDSLGRVNTLQKPVVQQAGFMVLKSPDIPSVLVETAFISNPEEERLLGDADYQDKLASSIFEGVRSYFARYRPLQQVAVSERESSHRGTQAHAVPVSRKSARAD